MRVVERYSHLNGEEFLLVHRRDLWLEILDVIKSVDATSCRVKRSQEKRKHGRLLYSPIAMNDALARSFKTRNWQQRRQTFWVTADAKVLGNL